MKSNGFIHTTLLGLIIVGTLCAAFLIVYISRVSRQETASSTVSQETPIIPQDSARVPPSSSQSEPLLEPLENDFFLLNEQLNTVDITLNEYGE